MRGGQGRQGAQGGAGSGQGALVWQGAAGATGAVGGSMCPLYGAEDKASGALGSAVVWQQPGCRRALVGQHHTSPALPNPPPAHPPTHLDLGLRAHVQHGAHHSPHHLEHCGQAARQASSEGQAARQAGRQRGATVRVRGEQGWEELSRAWQAHPVLPHAAAATAAGAAQPPRCCCCRCCLMWVHACHDSMPAMRASQPASQPASQMRLPTCGRVDDHRLAQRLGVVVLQRRGQPGRQGGQRRAGWATEAMSAGRPTWRQQQSVAGSPQMALQPPPHPSPPGQSQ